MSNWTIYVTPEARQIGVGGSLMDSVREHVQLTFFEDVASTSMANEPFPPSSAILDPHYIVIDSLENRWPQFICFGRFEVRPGVILYAMAPFPMWNTATQRQSFLVLVLPNAVARLGAILLDFERAGFSVYAIEYYLSAKSTIWSEHYEPLKDNPRFAATIQSLSNRRMAALQFYLPRARLHEAVAEAQRLFGELVTGGVVHISANMAAAVRERDIWFDDFEDREAEPMG